MKAWKSCLLLCALLPVTAGARDLEDVGRETQIYAAYATNDALRPLGLTVNVDDKRATLNGVVRSDAERRLAEQVARDSTGITDVDNRIEVDARQATALQRPPEKPEVRSWRQWSRDVLLTARIKLRLLRHDLGDALDVNVDIASGKARLSGVADSERRRTRLLEIAAATPGVKQVEDRMVLRPPEGTVPALDSPRASLSDAWIVTRLKSSFLISREVDGHAIAVSTSRGAVRLSGRVATPAERQAAVEIARGIRGVRVVDASGLSVG